MRRRDAKGRWLLVDLLLIFGLQYCIYVDSFMKNENGIREEKQTRQLDENICPPCDASTAVSVPGTLTIDRSTVIPP